MIKNVYLINWLFFSQITDEKKKKKVSFSFAAPSDEPAAPAIDSYTEAERKVIEELEEVDSIVSEMEQAMHKAMYELEQKYFQDIKPLIQKVSNRFIWALILLVSLTK